MLALYHNIILNEDMILNAIVTILMPIWYGYFHHPHVPSYMSSLNYHACISEMYN